MSFIELKRVSKRFGTLVVLNNLSLTIDRGQSLVVIGASGTGKSVMLKHIVGLLRPDHGEVWIDGRRIDNLPERALVDVRTRFGFLFQMGALFDSLNVAENVGFPIVEHTHKPPDEVAKIVAHKLKQVGLPDAGSKMPGELSGGQKKRVFLARSLAQEGRIILLDEPFTGIDVKTETAIIALLRELRASGHLMLISTHNLGSVPDFCDQVVLINRTVLAAGPTAQVFTQANLERAFGGVLRHFNLGGAALHSDEDPRRLTVLTDDERPLVLYGDERKAGAAAPDPNTRSPAPPKRPS